MIAYVTLGTNDIARAAKFYDELLGTIGIQRLMDLDRMILWGTSMDAPMLSICKPYDGAAATNGNGTMVSLGVASKEQVDALYRKALALGGTCEGAPGPRGPDAEFYIGYFRDLDRNKLNSFYAG
ncbi:MAG: hypothetical protein JWR16_2327 [Nevskia sp.]|nr:hypothetical protein [Nevskia sp.]